VQIIFRQADGTSVAVEAGAAENVMRVAINNDIPGILADCAGNCSCATCHVVVAEEWVSRLAPPNPLEDGMLDFVLERQDASRLSCQIPVSDAIDGLIVDVPESQV